MKKLLFLFFFLPFYLGAQWQLSERAEIRILTCGPYQGELYSAFGHSAIRVYDPVNNFDLLFNYGVFDFNQPNFYLNFAKGNLLYKLDVGYYEGFRDYYIADDRYIHEQILNLSPEQAQAYFNFLQHNARPENATYNYNYFFDNCATRVRDGLVQVLGDTVIFEEGYTDNEYKSIRDLCDQYLAFQPWGDLGIDLCLGLPIDKRASSYEHMFLPDYLEAGLSNAYIVEGENRKPLVKQTVLTHKSEHEPAGPGFWRPLTITLAILIIGLVASFISFRTGKYQVWFDVALFGLTGLFGWFFIFLWFFTDHHAADNNLNILWALPWNFPLAFLLLKRPISKLLRRHYLILFFWYLLVGITFFVLPQDLHHSLFPLVLLLAVRSWLASRPRAYQKQKVGA